MGVKVGVAMPRVAVAYPCGGSVTVPFCVSLTRLVSAHGQLKQRDQYITRVFHKQGLYVSQNRNEIVKDFLRGGEDWLLQIDTDIEFGSDLVDCLLYAALQEKDVRILAANVRLGAHKHAAYMRLGNVWGPVEDLPKAAMVKADAAATACILIHRSVLVEMREKLGPVWFDHEYIPGDDEDGFTKSIEGGEDLMFCERARVMGIQTWLARGLKLRHWKATPLVEVME